MAIQALNVVAQSATTMTPPAAAANTTHVAKLIDISTCIGCKACQVACMEWNETRPEIGSTDGTYDNPTELGPAAWTVMKFNEVETATGGLDWLISAAVIACPVVRLMSPRSPKSQTRRRSAPCVRIASRLAKSQLA